MSAVNHPPHYTAHPSGIEAVEVCEHLSFNMGNALKYLWRAGKKGDAVEDLQKAESSERPDACEQTAGRSLL